MTGKNASLFLLLILLILGNALYSNAGSQRFRLIHADKMYLSRQQTEQILELAGKVHFFYGDTEFKSDRAIIFDKQKIARLNGNVKVFADTLSLTADSLAYYRIPDILNLGGKVLITETKPSGSLRTFRSEFATYDKAEDKLTTWKNVKAYDKEENAHISCGYAFWDRKAGYAFMLENPMVSAGTEDTLYIRSEKMEFFDADRKLIATFNVDTQSKDYKINSDFLIYFLKEDKAVFTGKPTFRSEYAIASAEEFYLYLKDRKPQSAELIDSCRVEFTEEAGAKPNNWVEANTIRLKMGDNYVKHFEAEGKVSYYFMQEKKGKKDYFENSATGEFMEANFNEDKSLDWMKMKHKIQGKYRFHNNS